MFEGENARFDEVTKEELAARTKTLDVSSIRLKEMVLDYGCREDLSHLLKPVERKDAILSVDQQLAVQQSSVQRSMAELVSIDDVPELLSMSSPFAVDARVVHKVA